MSPPLPDQIRFYGYVPRDLYETYQANKQLYAELGKATPFHTFWYGNSQYQTSYDSPFSAAVIYQGSEVQQIEEAGGFVSGSGAGAVVTFPAVEGTQIITVDPMTTTPTTPTTPTIDPTKVAVGGGMLLVGLAVIAVLAIVGRK